MGKHPHNALKAVGLAKKPPGRHADGNGLYLLVDPAESRRWVLRTVVRGRRKDIGLGSLRLVGLAEARNEAARLRKIARQGGDPLAERRKRKAMPSFETAARKVFAEHAPGWKNAKHAAQWISTLEMYAFPKLGSKAVDEISTPDVLEALLPIWLYKPETARRVKQRISTVFDWATANNYRSSINPVTGVKKGLPKQPETNRHFTALAFVDVPAFVEQLRVSDNAESVRLAFEFLILTAARTSEVIAVRWNEISNDVWTIPATRMKSKRDHRVPFSGRCLEILSLARDLGRGEYVFPGINKSGRPLSNMAFLMALRRMGAGVTAHGFRSSFRDWAAEETNFPSEVCEMALAHSIGNKTEAAYRRGDLFKKRRDLMNEWATFATRATNQFIPMLGKTKK